jgi:hypothetical protein
LRPSWKEAPPLPTGILPAWPNQLVGNRRLSGAAVQSEMSRKVLPRWGEIGVTKVPIFTVSNEQFADLCTQLGLTKSDIPPQLKARLERIATRYRLWVQQDEKGQSQAERNAALKQVLASPQDLELRLAQLDSTTEGELLDVLWLHPGIKSRGSLPLLDQIAAHDPELVIDCGARPISFTSASRPRRPAILALSSFSRDDRARPRCDSSPEHPTRSTPALSPCRWLLTMPVLETPPG